MKNIRDLLAMGWSIAAVLMIAYILIVHGHKVEILTLIIGLISGTIVGNIFGVYFNASHKIKPEGESSLEITTTETTPPEVE